MKNLLGPPVPEAAEEELRAQKRELPKVVVKSVPAFEEEVLLPDPLKWWIADNADRSGAPIEYIAIAALCGLGSLLSAKVEFQPKRHDTGWTVRPNLWGMAVGMPSSKKSPALSAGLAPLRALESESGKRFKEEEKERKKKRTVLKAKLDIVLADYKSLIRQNIKESGNTDESVITQAEADVELAQSEYDRQPTQRRFIINDATVEALGTVMAEWPGVLQYRDELTGWLNGLNREDRHNDRYFFLEAFNGNAGYTYDRVGRGVIPIEHNVLSVVGGIQRDKVKPLVRGSLGATEDNDGLLQRFQLMVYPDFKWREDSDRVPYEKGSQDVTELFARVAREPARLAPVQLDEAAYPVYRDWRHALQRRIASDEDMSAAMQSHLGKYEKLCIALAGLFALTTPTVGRAEVIDLASVNRAIAWCEFLEAHAQRIYGLADTQELEAAHLLMSRKDRLPEAFTPSEVRNKGWAGLSTVADVQSALNMLSDYGQVYQEALETGGRPKTVFKWVK